MRDLTEQRFGKLVVVRQGKRPNGKKYECVFWVCQCDCGAVKEVSSQALLNPKRPQRSCSVKCGHTRRLDDTEAARRHLISRYRRLAKLRGREWKLTKDQFFRITKEFCYYCGIEPSQLEFAGDGRSGYTYNGLDRLDSLKGYVEGNVVACCRRCNTAKNNQTIEEFYSWIDRICEFRGCVR